MHFVVVAIGSAGDLFPMLRLACGLRERGHRISFLAPELHRSYAESAALAFHPLPIDEAVLDDPLLWDARHGFGVVWRATRPAAAAFAAYVEQLPEHEPCVLLVHPLALPEADLCRASRAHLRIAAVYLAPSNLPTVHDPLLLGPYKVPRWVPLAWRHAMWRQLGKRLIDPLVLPAVNTARRQRGLAPVGSALDHLFGIADLSVALFPAWFAAAQPDWPQPLMQCDFPLYEPEPSALLSPALQAFLANGAPPIVFTAGTGNRQAAHLFSAAAAAVDRLGKRAIFLTPHRAQLPAALPDQVLWQEYVPLRTLLPRCVALVHHGGIGTTAEALLSGISQLVLPFSHDQFDNAARIKALGVGLCLPAAKLSPMRLTQYLRRVLSSHAVCERSRVVATVCGADPDLESLYAALQKCHANWKQ